MKPYGKGKYKCRPLQETKTVPVPVAAAFFVLYLCCLFANSLLRHSYCFVYLSCFRAIYILLGFCA